MIERAAIAADLGIKAHAHMLRHACGYKLADDGHDTRAIQSRASQHSEHDALYRPGAAAV
jgi:site-specific recombinase XerD